MQLMQRSAADGPLANFQHGYRLSCVTVHFNAVCIASSLHIHEGMSTARLHMKQRVVENAWKASCCLMMHFSPVGAERATPCKSVSEGNSRTWSVFWEPEKNVTCNLNRRMNRACPRCRNSTHCRNAIDPIIPLSSAVLGVRHLVTSTGRPQSAQNANTGC